ncbi:MAG TPA: c-type cytochrome, partial [Gemmata sp.]|nr:c-type cytochrome [Gemmata sp.]
ELAWLAEQAPGTEFVRDQIVPKVMRRLVATGKAEDLKLCIDFVAKLNDSSSREKALEGLAVALAGRTVNAPEGWSALQLQIVKGNNPKLVPLANKLAVSFRDPAAVKRAVAVLRDLGQTDDTRCEAIRQLALLKAENGDRLFLSVMREEFPLPVKIEAARGLAAFDNPQIPAEILKDWEKRPESLRAELIGVLASRKEWARALLQAMADKKIDRTQVTDNTILRIQAFRDRALDGLIAKAWGRTRPTPAELNTLIEKTRASLYESPASFARGKAVFAGICAKCHKFGGEGNEVGPQLEGASRDIDYLLVNVLDPNRVIGAPYFVRTVRTLDDVIYQGLLSEEDDKTLTLKLEGAAFKTIKKSDIADVRVSEKSLMPEGLGYNLTPQNFRDLVRYVMANPFITDVKVNGAELSVGVPGRLSLPDTKGAPAVVEAEVTAPGIVKTKLLVGSSADYEVRLDGKAIGTGKGTGKTLRPDQDSFDVSLTRGKHTLAIVVKGGAGNVLYARFLDPARKLSYPDVGEKK